MKDVIEAERAKAKAERLRQQAEAARRRDLIGTAVLSCFQGDDLRQFITRVIPAAIKERDDLALFDEWLKPGKSAG